MARDIYDGLGRRVSRHPDVRWLVEATEAQGCSLSRLEYDPEGGTAGQGRVWLMARVPDGRVVVHAGWGLRRNGRFEWAFRTSDDTCSCGHGWRHHDPDDLTCDHHADVGLGVCPCGRGGRCGS